MGSTSLGDPKSESEVEGVGTNVYLFLRYPLPSWEAGHRLQIGKGC